VKRIEVIARGVCVVDGQLLLCHSNGADNTYLPGGHVEFGEAAAAALEREIEEELGVAGEAGAFLGAVEHRFRQKGKRHCEVNLVFALDVPGLSAGEAPASAEPRIEFLWHALDDLQSSRLEPSPLRELLPGWAGGAGGVGWASTFPGSP
jgi:ADP-ribose pyrophosphatase YjhB (NUDIX family)